MTDRAEVTEDTPDIVRRAADKLDTEAKERQELLGKVTSGRWKLWGMSVLADQDGTSNVDHAVPVANTFMLVNGKPRTFDADLIAETRNEASARVRQDVVTAKWLRNCADRWDDNLLFTPEKSHALNIALTILKEG